MKIFLTNTLSGKKEEFIPIDKSDIKMYVCGPTVYDRPHIGNARSSVIFDLLFRLLRNVYSKVTYVRNITDVDDKIIDSANKNNESIPLLELYLAILPVVNVKPAFAKDVFSCDVKSVWL